MSDKEEIERLTKALEDMTKQRDQWKANHDNQVMIKRAVLDRPDLGDRAKAIKVLEKKLTEVERDRDSYKDRYHEECERNARFVERLSNNDTQVRAMVKAADARTIQELADEVLVLGRAHTDGLYVLKLARRIWRDLKHCIDDLPRDAHEMRQNYRWRLESFGQYLGRTEDYKTGLAGELMFLGMRYDLLQRQLDKQNNTAQSQR